MPANTPGGWPYVLPEDHPLEFPAHSQALANKLQTDATIVIAAMTPATGWADFGTSYGGLYVTKQGRLVTLGGLVKPTADKAVVTTAEYMLATLVAAYYPAADLIVPAAFKLSSASAPLSGFLSVYKNGNVSLSPGTAGTILAASGWVAIAATYRSAT